MNRLLSYIAGTFTGPRTTFQEIANDRPLAPAIIVFILTGVVTSLIAVTGIQTDLPAGTATFLFPVLAVGSVVFGAVAWLFQTGIYHVLGEFLGGTGRAYNLFTTLPFASLPGIILGPLGAIIRAFQVPVLGFITSLALGIWVLVLQVFAIKAVYNLNTLRAVAVILLPILIIITAVIAFAVTLAGAMVPLIIEVLPEIPLAM